MLYADYGKKNRLHRQSTSHANRREDKGPSSLRRKGIEVTRQFSNLQNLSMPYANCGGKSGDRQRREKALPFLKEEKSEHERARTYVLSR